MMNHTYGFVEVEGKVVFLECRVDHTPVVVIQQEVLGVVLASLKQRYTIYIYLRGSSAV